MLPPKTQWTSPRQPLDPDTDMKNNGLTNILNWALIVGADRPVQAGSSIITKAKRRAPIAGLLVEFNQLQTAQSIVSGLINALMEYSKTHPEINPTLEAIGIKT